MDAAEPWHEPATVLRAALATVMAAKAMAPLGMAALAALLEHLGLPDISVDGPSGTQLAAPAAQLAPASDGDAPQHSPPQSALACALMRAQDRQKLTEPRRPKDALKNEYWLHPAAVAESVKSQPGFEAVSLRRGPFSTSPPLSLWLVQRACLQHYGSIAGWQEVQRELRMGRRQRLVDAIAHKGFSAQPAQEVDASALMRAYVQRGAVPHAFANDTSGGVDTVIWAALVDPWLQQHASLKHCFARIHSERVSFMLSMAADGYEGSEAEWASKEAFFFQCTSWGTQEGNELMWQARIAALATWVQRRGGKAAALALQPPQAIQQLIAREFHITGKE